MPSARATAFHVAAATAANTASDANARGASVDGTISTVTGGIARAGMIPNDRIVRSSTSPVSAATASPSVSTQPSAMCVAPIAYERTTTSSSGSPASTRTATVSMRPVASSTSRCAPASAPSADNARVSSSTAAPRPSTSSARSTPAASSAPSTRTVYSASPAARSRFDTGGPGTYVTSQRASTSSAYGVSTSGGTSRVRPRISTRPSRYTAVAAIGDRFGPSRTTSSRANTTRTGPSSASANASAASGTDESHFPPNAPPLASGEVTARDIAPVAQLASGSR